MKYKKTIIIILAFVFCIILILKGFFAYGDSSKSKVAKDVLKLIEEKGIELDEEKRKFIEEAIRREEELDRQYEEYKKWAKEQAKKIKGRWKEVLSEQIKEADRIEIQEAWTAEPNMPREVLHVIKGNNKVMGFLDALEISEWRSGGYCACHGDARFVFYKAEEKVATLSYHHNKRLRWYDGQWPGDAELTGESKIKLPKWFASEGYPAFEGNRMDDVRERAIFKKAWGEFIKSKEGFFALGAVIVIFAAAPFILKYALALVRK